MINKISIFRSTFFVLIVTLSTISASQAPPMLRCTYQDGSTKIVPRGDDDLFSCEGYRGNLVKIEVQTGDKWTVISEPSTETDLLKEALGKKERFRKEVEHFTTAERA